MRLSGATLREIADRLDIDVRTLKRHFEADLMLGDPRVRAQLTADEVEALECPVPKGTRVKWEKSGDWQLATVPVGATLNGVMHQLAVANIPFKVGNDAPKTIGDLAKRAPDEASSKVVGIKSKRAPKGEG